jgi:beta-galactosidase
MFYFGTDYYPEHWPEERWPEDARLMAEAGINVVRLAEFAWSWMEPKKGKYDFEWLDRAISILHSHGIEVVLGTPTAAPPPWLMSRHPEIFLVREDGRRVTYGNRREYCPSNPVYHDYTRCIVTEMAEHYADNPAVIGWQIDNEFGARCYCPVSAAAFREWLRERYGSLDELNERWGTIFWSHVYTDWDQIPVPLETGGSPNPGLALDFARFSSDAYVAYQKMQLDILRQKCPSHFITHNFMGFKFDLINYFDLARDLDFVAWDNYQRMQWRMAMEVDPGYAGLAADCMRGLKRKNVWVMEQQSGPGGWEIVSVATRPGELRLWAYQTIAHGADAVVFFRWRTARFGTEEYWHGLLDHDGRVGRRYEEIERMGAEIRRAGDTICGAVIKSSVAIVNSYDSRFAFQIQGNNPQFSYPLAVYQFYHPFYRRQVSVDVVAPTDDLSGYKLVVAPALHVVSEEVAENLRRFAEAGGVLVITARTGVKDMANAVVNQRLPGLLAELCGVAVEEYDSLPEDVENGLEFTVHELTTGRPVAARAWCDVLELRGAATIARYTSDYYAGKPAITLNQFGQGKVLYVGTMGDERLYEKLTGWLLGMAGVRRIIAAPDGVEVTERWQGDQRLLFVLNHTDREQEITLDKNYKDLLSDSNALVGTITIAPRDVLALVEEG